MKTRLHRLLLAVYRRCPVAVRRRVVRWYSPSFTLGAMCFIERADGSMLFVRHSYRQRWGVPGGLVQRREDPADAVCREVYEEVGLRIELGGAPVVVVDPVPQRIDLVFRATLASGDRGVAIPSSPEILEARWFAPDRLPELQFETRDALINLARRQDIVRMASA